MVHVLNRDCISCGGSMITVKICMWDTQKRAVIMETGYRPEWCPVDDEEFKREKWERKAE